MNSTIRNVALLGGLVIIGIIAMQAYWVTSTWNLNEEEFDQKVHLVLVNVAKSLVELEGGTLPKDIIKRQASNYYIVNLENEIDANKLDFYLRDKFQDIGMNVNFEYAIHDCSNNEMVYGKYIKFSEDKEENVKLGELPTYKDLTYYFGVKFPDRSRHLLGKMTLSVFFSVILFFTVLFFMYSMFVILRQKRLSEMQKDFINNMTHEFKTPISTIKISSDVFLKNPIIQKDERLLRYAQIIKEQNLRLNKQVEKVLQLAKIERDNFKLTKEKINLNELVQTISESTEVNLASKKGQLLKKLNAIDPIIIADKLHLTNIIHNLLDNAIKYCKESPVITVESISNDKNTILTITDNGIGIPAEHQQKVFTKFYRVPTGNVHNVKGFGLGLFYVKNVCAAHGWKINLTSGENEGTSVSITINK